MLCCLFLIPGHRHQITGQGVDSWKSLADLHFPDEEAAVLGELVPERAQNPPTTPKLLLIHSAASWSVNQGTGLSAITVIMNRGVKDQQTCLKKKMVPFIFLLESGIRP